MQIRQTELFAPLVGRSARQPRVDAYQYPHSPAVAWQSRDVKRVGGAVSEMRIDYGPGYRIYFVQRGEALVILLAGGDKSTQDRDIARACELAREL